MHMNDLSIWDWSQFPEKGLEYDKLKTRKARLRPHNKTSKPSTWQDVVEENLH